MCKIVEKRKSKNYVYLHVIDDDTYSVKKMKTDDYNFAAGFNNPDFLNMVSVLTTDKDIADSYYAVAF